MAGNAQPFDCLDIMVRQLRVPFPGPVLQLDDQKAALPISLTIVRSLLL